jgi:hypothetical protein
MHSLFTFVLVLCALSASALAEPHPLATGTPRGCGERAVAVDARGMIQFAQSGCRGDCSSRRGYCLSSCRDGDRQCRAICNDLYQSCLSSCRR